MVGRRADELQAERPVHPGLETDQLERSQSLVVIHRHDGVVSADEGLVEQRVRAHRADDLQPLGQGQLDGGPDDPDLLVADVAAFARVGIEAADSDPRARQLQQAAGFGGSPDSLEDVLDRQRFRHGAEGDMRRHQRDAEPAVPVIAAEKHHGRVRLTTQPGEELCLPGEAVMARPQDGFLVHRGRDERGQVPAETLACALAQKSQRGVGHRGGARRQRLGHGGADRIDHHDPVGRTGGRQGQEVEFRSQLPVECAEEAEGSDQGEAGPRFRQQRGHGLERYFRADARDVSDGESDHGAFIPASRRSPRG